MAEPQPARAAMRFAALAASSALIAMTAGAAEETQPRKDAAESVGEGNAARWLEYYRRERGEAWAPPPASDSSPEKSSGDRDTTRDPQAPPAGASNAVPSPE